MKIVKCTTFALALLASVSALAADVTVAVNGMAFEPLVGKAQPGDTIVWTNMASQGHNTESIPGLIPEGAKEWKSEYGKDFKHTVDKPGAYIYICAPHATQGMIGALVVGDGKPENLAALETNVQGMKGTSNYSGANRALKKLKAYLKEQGLE